MRYLFFTNTPAHVHLYKHTVQHLEEQGHEVLVLGRRYGCTEELLEYHDLPYQIYGECDTSRWSLFRELPRHYIGALRRAVQFGPDYVFGYGAYAAHTGAVLRVPTVLLFDSEPELLNQAVSRPFAHAIITPHAFEKDLGAKHYHFHGFLELAYLHPEVYEPTGDARTALGLAPNERFAVLRFNALGAHHDVGHTGFDPDQRRRLIEELDAHATVLVSDEGGKFDVEDTPARPFDLHPALVHDVLAEADLLVADTQTMATEAALLGTPAIRSNSFVGESDMGNFVELEEHGLIRNLQSFDEVRKTALRFLRDDELTEGWQQRRDEYVADTVNLTDLLIEVIRNVESLDRVDGLWTESVPPVSQAGP